ncbi:response regulator [soil metagenome]
MNATPEPLQTLQSSRADVPKQAFQKILARNVALPLIAMALAAIVFVGLILYLMSVARWVESADRTIGRANQTFKLLIDGETGYRGFLLAGTNEFLEPYNASATGVQRGVEELEASVADTPGQVARLQELSTKYTAWRNYAEEGIALRRSAGSATGAVAELVSNRRGKQMMDDMRDTFGEFIHVEEAIRAQRSRDAQTTATVLVIIVVAMGLLIGLGLALSSRSQLRALADSYGGALEDEMAHTRSLERQNWIRNGETGLAQVMLGEQSVGNLTSSLLGYLVSYLGAAVGSVHSSNDGQRFTRSAAHAFADESAKSSRTFLRGQGLAGQALAENRVLRLDDVPADYLKVASTLGDSTVREVLIIPARGNVGSNVLVELGFMNAMPEPAMDFIAEVAPAIGKAVEAAIVRERLAEILHETQQLNEELQAQQEELRVANEELEAQSQALRESQARLEGQQAELEQNNDQLEEQTQALEMNRAELERRNEALNDAQTLLEDRADQLERASTYKSEFLANMSHELRTPLNSSLILAKLLSDNATGNLSDEQIQFAQSIYASGNDLLRLINDILDLSKVEAGKLEVVLEDVAPSRVVAELDQLFRPIAAQRRLEFAVEVAPGLPSSIHTDSQRLQQVIKNLLSNAFKFTEKGTVRLSVQPAPHGGIAWSVSDTGIGIAAEQQETIFEAFRQADGATTRRYGGTGLGLSISRELSMLLGGTLTLTSRPGQGSRFTLTVPASIDAAQPVTPASERTAAAAPDAVVEPFRATSVTATQAQVVPTPAVRRQTEVEDDRDHLAPGARTILMVEDDVPFVRILMSLAHEMGFNCLVATAADEGHALAAEYRPDAVLLDMKLPDHSGLTVLERLKNDPTTRHLPVHVISAMDNREPALQMGAIGYLQKPTSSDSLREMFQRIEVKLAQKIKHVLIVEDDNVQRDAMARLIGDDEVRITAVARASEALEALSTTVFDCMVIDLTLPDMAGHELLRAMAESELASFPPVIVYTGRLLSSAEEEQLRRYSRSIIIKGARSPERLLDEVTLFLHRVENRLPPERQRMLRAARDSEKIFEGRRILLADDDVRNIFALTSALESKGAVVEIARNGRQALEKLDTVASIELVLMDIMMPEMDGYEAIREIRKQRRFADLPIIGVTARAMRDDQEKCIEAGANDYLAKPVDLDKLISLIRVWMPKFARR